MEGQRFFDLRRWGIADTTINNFVAVEKNRRSFLTAATPFAARYRLYPIPSLPIELSKVGGASTLQPNPGWEPGASPAPDRQRERKSTRLKSRHGYISYARFCF